MTRADDSPVPDYAARLSLADRSFIVLGAGNGMGRQTAHALQQRFVESNDLFACVVLCFRQTIFKGEHAICGAAKVGGTEVQEAFEEQAGGDEKDHGEGYLRDEQNFTKRRARCAAAY